MNCRYLCTTAGAQSISSINDVMVLQREWCHVPQSQISPVPTQSGQNGKGTERKTVISSIFSRWASPNTGQTNKQKIQHDNRWGSHINWKLRDENHAWPPSGRAYRCSGIMRHGNFTASGQRERLCYLPSSVCTWLAPRQPASRNPSLCVSARWWLWETWWKHVMDG